MRFLKYQIKQRTNPFKLQHQSDNLYGRKKPQPKTCNAIAQHHKIHHEQRNGRKAQTRHCLVGHKSRITNKKAFVIRYFNDGFYTCRV